MRSTSILSKRLLRHKYPHHASQEAGRQTCSSLPVSGIAEAGEVCEAASGNTEQVQPNIFPIEERKHINGTPQTGILSATLSLRLFSAVKTQCHHALPVQCCRLLVPRHRVTGIHRYGNVAEDGWLQNLQST